MSSYHNLQKLCMQNREKHTVPCNSSRDALEELSRNLLEYELGANGTQTIKILSWNMWYKSNDADRKRIITALKKSDADIIAIQEGVGATQFQTFASENGYRMSHLSHLGKEQQFTLWRPSVGNVIHISKGLFERGRPYTMIRFSSFVFVNIHAGHGYDTQTYFQRIPLSPNDTHIVMAGDFNKNLKRVNIGGRTLFSGAKTSLKTCCASGPMKKGRMKYSADHLMSNMKFSQHTRIFPHGHAASDHLPITGTVIV